MPNTRRQDLVRAAKAAAQRYAPGAGPGRDSLVSLGNPILRKTLIIGYTQTSKDSLGNRRMLMKHPSQESKSHSQYLYY
jgi:hypothetical protein